MATIGSLAIDAGSGLCVATSFRVWRVAFSGTAAADGGDTAAPRSAAVRRVAVLGDLVAFFAFSSGFSGNVLVSIVTGLTLRSLTTSGGITGSGGCWGTALACRRALRLQGGACSTSSTGCAVGAKGFDGGGSTLDGSQIMCAKLVLILILIECGLCAAAAGWTCGWATGEGSRATGSADGLSWAIAVGSRLGASSVSTASNSAVVAMANGSAAATGA